LCCSSYWKTSIKLYLQACSHVKLCLSKGMQIIHWLSCNKTLAGIIYLLIYFRMRCITENSLSGPC
jgi:hypothetical protein